MNFVEREIVAAAGGWIVDIAWALGSLGALGLAGGALVVLAAMAMGVRL